MRVPRHRGRGIIWGSWPGKWFGWLARVSQWLGPRGAKRRQRMIVGTTLAAAFLVGYLMAALVLFPAPIFPRSQQVPRVIGLPSAEAFALLERSELIASDTETVSHPEAPGGQVVWQDPPPGVAVPEGAGVAVSVSRGPRRVPVPDVAGYVQEIAVQLIEAAGLTVARIDTSVAPVERGVVVNTRPTAGQSRDPGDGVVLFVSVGAATISVPDLIGLTTDEARELLEQSGLVLGSIRMRTTDRNPPGLIFEQAPGEGTLSAPGAAVNVTVERGDPP